MASFSLLDLPRPFLTQLLQELDFSSVHALLTTSQQAFSLVWELKPGALCLWGPEARHPLKQMLHLLRNLAALLLPDCGDKCRLPRYSTLHMPSLRTAVLHYTFPYCMRLDAAAHPNKIESIIVRGWNLDSIFNLRLSMFLDQLDRLDGLQHLVLALPCAGVSCMILGRLTRLRSLRMCADVSHSSETLLRQDSDLTWKAGCWQSGISPLTQLTSLQLKVPLVLGPGDDLHLEALSGLRRLELLLDRPVVSDGNSMAEMLGEAAGGAQAANVFLQQPGLPSLQHLTRLVLSTTFHRSFFMFDAEAGGLRSAPDDTMDTLAHLTALVSLHITPAEWSFSLQQLQPLSACTRLTELALPQLALGFANDPRRIDRNGTQLSREEKAVVQAATAAAAALHKQQQGAAVSAGPSPVCGATAGASSSVSPEPMQGVQTSPVARAPSAAAAARGPSSRAAAGAAADTRSGAADGSSGISGSSSSFKTVAVNGRQVQVPLLPQLVVLRFGSLWWRLPLVVLSPRLEDVTYKRLSGTDGGTFVMTDLQNMEEFNGPGADVFANLLADLGDVPPLQAEAAENVLGQLLFGAQQAWQGLPALQGAAAAVLPEPNPQLEQQQQQEMQPWQQELLQQQQAWAAAGLGGLGGEHVQDMQQQGQQQQQQQLNELEAQLMQDQQHHGLAHQMAVPEAAADPQAAAGGSSAAAEAWAAAAEAAAADAQATAGDDSAAAVAWAAAAEAAADPQAAAGSMSAAAAAWAAAAEAAADPQVAAGGGSAAAAAWAAAAEAAAAAADPQAVAVNGLDGAAEQQLDLEVAAGGGSAAAAAWAAAAEAAADPQAAAGGVSAAAAAWAAAAEAAAAAAAGPQAAAVDGLDGSFDSGQGSPQTPPLLDVHHGPEVLDLMHDMQGVQQQQQQQQQQEQPLGALQAAAQQALAQQMAGPGPGQQAAAGDGAAAAAAVAAATGEDAAAAAAITAAGVLPAEPLSDAPADQVYADVLRGLRGLRKLDVDVTGLCKVVKLSSSPLAGVSELRVHMLGAVQLPQGGLPRLPSLTHLEFYLPAERSWEADYNDYEDLPLWQHQSNVRQLIIRGTYHAGGFFAPGHLQLASACMPHITRLVLRQCQDLRPEHLQKVVDSKVSRYIEVVEGSNFGAAVGARAAAAGGGGAAAGGEGARATAWPEGVDETTPSSSVGGYGLEDMSMDGDAEADSEGDGDSEEEEEGHEEEGHEEEGREEGGVSAGGGGGGEGATLPAAQSGGSEAAGVGQSEGMAWDQQEGGGAGVGSPLSGLLPVADDGSEQLQEEGGGAGVGSPPGLLPVVDDGSEEQQEEGGGAGVGSPWGQQQQQQQQQQPIADDDSEELQEEEGGGEGVGSPPPGFLPNLGSEDSEEEDGGASAEGGGSSGWQRPDPVAAAKAAREARQAGMRDVAVAAAGVGVIVSLLPVKRWQDWYKEMLE